MNFEIYIGWLKLHSRVYTQQVMNFGIPDNSKQYNQYNINQWHEVHYPQVCLEFFFFFFGHVKNSLWTFSFYYFMILRQWNILITFSFSLSFVLH